MASYAFWDESAQPFHLGPPVHPMSEDTDPNWTAKLTFELAHWKFGLGVASACKRRQGQRPPGSGTHVAGHLAPLPVSDDAWAIYEGVPTMWSTTTSDEGLPSMLGIYGWPRPQLKQWDLSVMERTAQHVYETRNFTASHGELSPDALAISLLTLRHRLGLSLTGDERCTSGRFAEGPLTFYCGRCSDSMTLADRSVARGCLRRMLRGRPVCSRRSPCWLEGGMAAKDRTFRRTGRWTWGASGQR